MPAVQTAGTYSHQDPSVVVQLVNDTTPDCFNTELFTSSRKEPGNFKAKAP